MGLNPLHAAQLTLDAGQRKQGGLAGSGSCLGRRGAQPFAQEQASRRLLPGVSCCSLHAAACDHVGSKLRLLMVPLPVAVVGLQPTATLVWSGSSQQHPGFGVAPANSMTNFWCRSTLLWVPKQQSSGVPV